MSQLRLVMMKVLDEQPSSGYGLVRKINEKTGWKPSFGSVYPNLEDMKKKGIVSLKVQGRKKIYSLTSTGKKKIEKWENNKGEMLETMKEHVNVMGAITGHDISPVLEMLERMKSGEDPMARVSPEIYDFRNAMIKKVLDGLNEKQSEELRNMFKEMKDRIKKL